MPTKEILNSYSVLELRKEVSKTNLKGYSKMKKSEVVELMMKPNNKPKFHHIKAKTKAKAAPPAPSLVTEAPKKTYKFKKKEKPVLDPEKKARIQRKVAILNRKQIALNKKKARQTAELAKKLMDEKPKKEKAPEPKKTYKFKKKEKAKPSSVGVAVVPAKKLTTAGEKLTGLTKAEMNKLSPSELFGQLPVALAKMVLDPKTTGIQVGQVSISKLGEDDLIYDNPHMEDRHDEESNYFDTMGYRNDYTDFLTSKQNRFYNKHSIDYRNGSANERVADKMEALEQKLYEGVSNSVSKSRRKGMRAWKKKNKGMTGSLNALQKKFADFYEQF